MSGSGVVRLEGARTVRDSNFAQMIQQQLNQELEIQDEQYARNLAKQEMERRSPQPRDRMPPRSRDQRQDISTVRQDEGRDRTREGMERSSPQPCETIPLRTRDHQQHIATERQDEGSDVIRIQESAIDSGSDSYSRAGHLAAELELRRRALGQRIMGDNRRRWTQINNRWVPLDRNQRDITAGAAQTETADMDDYEANWQLEERQGAVKTNIMAKKEIDRLPTYNYNGPSASSDSDSDMCAICNCEFELNDTLRTLPCFHRYHGACIDPWLKTKAECPICRKSTKQPKRR